MKHIVYNEENKSVDFLFEENLGRVYISCIFENKQRNYMMVVPKDRFWSTIMTASREKLASLCETPKFDLETSKEYTIANATRLLRDADELVGEIKNIEATTENGFRKRVVDIAMAMDINPIIICKLSCVAYSRSEYASYVASIIERIRNSWEEFA